MAEAGRADDSSGALPAGFLHPRFWGTWIMMGILRLVVALPYAGRVVIGQSLGVLLFLLMGRRRRIARTNLSLCFPGMSAANRERLLKAHFRALGVTFIEMGTCWWVPDRRLEGLVEFEGMEHLQAALANGRGAILLSAHFLAMEMGLRLLSQRKYLCVIYRPHNNPLFDWIIQNGRTRHDHQGMIISRDDVRGLLGALKRNHPVWYPPDQDYGPKHSVFVEFFAQTAATITTTARYARMSGAPVIPFFMYRRRGFRGYRLVFEPPLTDFPSGDELKDARRVNEVLEDGIRRRPEQYLWVHRRFKTRPESGQNLYRR